MFCTQMTQRLWLRNWVDSIDTRIPSDERLCRLEYAGLMNALRTSSAMGT